MITDFVFTQAAFLPFPGTRLRSPYAPGERVSTKTVVLLHDQALLLTESGQVRALIT